VVRFPRRDREERRNPVATSMATRREIRLSKDCLESGETILDLAFPGRDGGTGRRSGLKIRRASALGGSTPPPGTTLLRLTNLVALLLIQICVSTQPIGLAPNAELQNWAKETRPSLPPAFPVSRSSPVLGLVKEAYAETLTGKA
jgi:hypothetical protein